MARASRAKSPAPKGDRLADAAMPITSARQVINLPATAEPVINGPTMGYQDGDGTVYTKVFHDGVVPAGWNASPADCEQDYRTVGLTSAR